MSLTLNGKFCIRNVSFVAPNCIDKIELPNHKFTLWLFFLSAYWRSVLQHPPVCGFREAFKRRGRIRNTGNSVVDFVLGVARVTQWGIFFMPNAGGKSC